MPCPEPRGGQAMRRRDLIKGIGGVAVAWPSAIYARQVLAFNLATFAEPFEKGCHLPPVIFGGVHKSDHRHFRLLPEPLAQ